MNGSSRSRTVVPRQATRQPPSYPLRASQLIPTLDRPAAPARTISPAALRSSPHQLPVMAVEGGLSVRDTAPRKCGGGCGTCPRLSFPCRSHICRPGQLSTTVPGSVLGAHTVRSEHIISSSPHRTPSPTCSQVHWRVSVGQYPGDRTEVTRGPGTCHDQPMTLKGAYDSPQPDSSRP